MAIKLCVVSDTSAHDFDIIGASEMCMEPSKFTPDNVFQRWCSYDSQDPAVEINCPADCPHRGSYDDSESGTKRYYCYCLASSADDCIPGEGRATAPGWLWSACDAAHGRRRANSKAAWQL